MSRLRSCFALLAFVLVVVAATGETAVGASPQAVQAHVVIPPGQPLQIAVAVDDTGLGAFFGPSAREAVQMAIEQHPTVRGFPDQGQRLQRAVRQRLACLPGRQHDGRERRGRQHPDRRGARPDVLAGGHGVAADLPDRGARHDQRQHDRDPWPPSARRSSTALPYRTPTSRRGTRPSRRCPAICVGGARSRRASGHRRATSPTSTTTRPTCSSRRSRRPRRSTTEAW